MERGVGHEDLGSEAAAAARLRQLAPPASGAVRPEAQRREGKLSVSENQALVDRGPLLLLVKGARDAQLPTRQHGDVLRHQRATLPRKFVPGAVEVPTRHEASRTPSRRQVESAKPLVLGVDHVEYLQTAVEGDAPRLVELLVILLSGVVAAEAAARRLDAGCLHVDQMHAADVPTIRHGEQWSAELDEAWPSQRVAHRALLRSLDRAERLER
eukprot:scaffold100219_cov66-Phaeocystis_antarctica.AAC.1